MLRVCEAAAVIEHAEKEDAGRDAAEDLKEALDLQLRTLGAALEMLAGHPGLRAVSGTPVAPPQEQSEVLLGVQVPASPASLRHCGSADAEAGGGEAQGKRDMLEISFDLDEHGGPHVDAQVEFFPDGSISIHWAASDLPIPLPCVLCFVHEVDLLGELAPFIAASGVLHQFSWNEADRLVRLVTKPPIPWVPALEMVKQRFGFDLLDTPWGSFCLVEIGPDWVKPPGEDAQQWRRVPRPPPLQRGNKQVDVRGVVALGRPVGPEGKLCTILFAGSGALKVSRSLLPNWLVSWLVKTTGHCIYRKALECAAKLDASKFGPRYHDSSFYAELHRRIAQFVREKAATASGAA